MKLFARMSLKRAREDLVSYWCVETNECGYEYVCIRVLREVKSRPGERERERERERDRQTDRQTKRKLWAFQICKYSDVYTISVWLTHVSDCIIVCTRRCINNNGNVLTDKMRTGDLFCLCLCACKCGDLFCLQKKSCNVVVFTIIASHDVSFQFLFCFADFYRSLFFLSISSFFFLHIKRK